MNVKVDPVLKHHDISACWESTGEVPCILNVLLVSKGKTRSPMSSMSRSYIPLPLGGCMVSSRTDFAL
jgi:hypothetical protein